MKSCARIKRFTAIFAISSRLAHESQARQGGGAPPPKFGQSRSFALLELWINRQEREI
jgi:hypothetical protein